MRTVAFFLALLAALPGCVSVQPQHKARLADPIMLFNAEWLDGTFASEVLPSREGAAGSLGGVRGGCGCK